MDKVFITKNDLAKSIQKRQQNVGPFLLSVVWVWFFTSVVLFFIPSIVLMCLLLILYLPFYWVDQAIIRRRNNV
jgi:hypothetical protein